MSLEKYPFLEWLQPGNRFIQVREWYDEDDDTSKVEYTLRVFNSICLPNYVSGEWPIVFSKRLARGKMDEGGILGIVCYGVHENHPIVLECLKKYRNKEKDFYILKEDYTTLVRKITATT